jgi:hypothetical protein
MEKMKSHIFALSTEQNSAMQQSLADLTARERRPASSFADHQLRPAIIPCSMALD